MHLKKCLACFVVLFAATHASNAEPLSPETAGIIAAQLKQPLPARREVLALVFETVGAPPSRQEIESSLRKTLGRGVGSSPAEIAKLEESVRRNADMQMGLLHASMPTRFRVRTDDRVVRIDTLTKMDASIPGIEEPFDYSRIIRLEANGAVKEELFLDHQLRSVVTRGGRPSFQPPSWLDFEGLPAVARGALLQYVATSLRVSLADVSALPADTIAAVLTKAPDAQAQWRIQETDGDGVVALSFVAPNLKEPLLQLDLEGEALERTVRITFRDSMGGNLLFSREVTERDDRGGVIRFRQQEFDGKGSLLRSFDVMINASRDSNQDQTLTHLEPLDTIPSLYMPSPLNR